ncbi:MAG: sodium/glutamate symporter [Pirellulales bacterium]
MIQLDLVQTLAAGGLALFLGVAVVRAVPALARYNVPAAVVGGLLVASLITLARGTGVATIGFDTTLQTPLMTAFFTSIGLSASVSLLRAGSGQALVFLSLATVLAVVQNAIGIGVAVAFGETPLLGVLMSSTALAGGPATALAFAPQFAAAGVPAAESLAIAAAMAGIVLGGLLGGPIATHLLERQRLQGTGSRGPRSAPPAPPAAAYEPDAGPGGVDEHDEEGDVRDALKALTTLLVAMAAGGILSAGFVRAGLTLPGYVGAMLAGALLRNLDDATGWFRIPHDLAAGIGSVCLTLFLTIALVNLRLWELAALAAPLVVNLLLQAVAVAAFCRWLVFPVMGRDYDAAVMTGGFTGFMLGTTANAMAVMHTLVERFGPAPRAFVVAPIVGAFFIDFTNAIVITTFLSLFS